MQDALLPVNRMWQEMIHHRHAIFHLLHEQNRNPGKTPCINIYSISLLLTQASFSLAIAALPGFPGDSVGKESACNIGDLSSIPGSGRSPAEGNGHPLQHSGLGKSQGQRSLAGYSPWGRKESDTTEQLNHHIATSFAQIAPSRPHCGRRGTMIRPIL